MDGGIKNKVKLRLSEVCHQVRENGIDAEGYRTLIDNVSFQGLDLQQINYEIQSLVLLDKENTNMNTNNQYIDSKVVGKLLRAEIYGIVQPMINDDLLYLISKCNRDRGQQFYQDEFIPMLLNWLFRILPSNSNNEGSNPFENRDFVPSGREFSGARNIQNINISTINLNKHILWWYNTFIRLQKEDAVYIEEALNLFSCYITFFLQKSGGDVLLNHLVFIESLKFVPIMEITSTLITEYYSSDKDKYYGFVLIAMEEKYIEPTKLIKNEQLEDVKVPIGDWALELVYRLVYNYGLLTNVVMEGQVAKKYSIPCNREIFSKLWCRFICWFSYFLKNHGHKKYLFRNIDAFIGLYNELLDTIREVLADFAGGTISVSVCQLLMKIVPFNKIWSILNVYSSQEIVRVNHLINETKKVLEQLNSITECFFKHQKIHEFILQLLSSFSNYHINELFYLTRNTNFNTENNTKSFGNRERLPIILLKSLNWFYNLLHCDLFKFIWNECKSDVGERVIHPHDAFFIPGNNFHELNVIIPASIRWIELYDQLNTGSIAFGRLKSLASILLSKSISIEKLSSTATGFFNKSQNQQAEEREIVDQYEWNVNKIDTAWCNSLSNKLKNWYHLYQVYENIDSIISIFNCLHQFIIPSDSKKLDELIQSAIKIKSSFTNESFPVPSLPGVPSLEPMEASVPASTIPVDNEEASPSIQPPLVVFDDEKLENLHKYLPFSMLVDEVFIIARYELFESIIQSMELLIWLKDYPDEKNFKTNLEAALGKSEMECPAELWDNEPGNTGVSATKLSQLSTVREQLYELIYRKDELIPLQLLIEIIKRIGRSSDGLITSIREANQHRLAFMELFGSESESSSVNRLLQLIQPDKNAHWVCTNYINNRVNVLQSSETESSSDSSHQQIIPKGQLTLQWVIKRRGNEQLLEKQQNINELMDFQSSIVLSRTDQKTEETQEIIKTFIEQLGWMKELNEQLTLLHQYGHFNFQSFKYQFPITTHPNIIYDRVTQCKELLKNWIFDVEQQRMHYYFLNYFSMKHISTLLCISSKYIQLPNGNDCMDTDNDWINDRSNELNKILTVTLQLVNYNSSLNHETKNHFMQQYKSFWIKCLKEKQEKHEGGNKEGGNEYADLSACSKLQLIGESLQNTLKDIDPPLRKVEMASISAYPSGSKLDQLVHLVCSDKVFEQILSLYAREGYLPERELVYVCRRDTKWEEIQSLLIRWGLSHDHSRSNKVYCLAGVDSLSFELQRKTTLKIRQLIQLAKNKLILISEQSDKQHIIAQFSHTKASILPLPDFILRSFTDAFNSTELNYSHGLKVFLSDYAGAGKTYSIRRLANDKSAIYIPISIVTSEGFYDAFADAIQYSKDKYVEDNKCEYSDEDDYLLYHFDIYDTVNEDFNAILFDFIFLGGIFDTNKYPLFWSPSNISIVIELAAGNSLFSRLTMCNLLPQEKIATNRDNFGEELRIGMGKENYYSPRYDGTTIRSNKNYAKGYSAGRRLKYVCMILDIMRLNNGRLPYIEEDNNIDILESLKLSASKSSFNSSTSHPTNRNDSISNGEDNKLPMSECFDLLLEASGLNKKRASMWCLWNFINVFYWQLRDMHYPNSPINCACMPDPNSQKDILEKSTLKGQVVVFLRNTAREFATRKLKAVDQSEKITHLWVSGFNKEDANGLYVRKVYKYDDKPVFVLEREKTPSGKTQIPLYIYFRKSIGCWVLDNETTATGPYYSASSNANIHSLWKSRTGLAPVSTMSGVAVSDPRAFEGKAVRISGCPTENVNGLYLRLHNIDDINRKNHFLLENVDGTKRHLFYERANYNIAPVCNSSEGILAACVKDFPFAGGWNAIAPPFEEVRLSFQFVLGKDVEKYQIAPVLFKNADVQSHFSSVIGETTFNDENQDIDVEETMEQIFENTQKWNDSNHECLLFSNYNHVVSFLSLDPDQLKKNMSPQLYEHLQRNKINVGENLNKLNANFFQILSALTDIAKDESEAKQILGGKYCLTGDSLLKMLAIFARLRCGVPVVLMGECGCGKTMLISYLCAWMNYELITLDVHGGTTEKDILNIFLKAEKSIESNKKEVFVFLDEINTCAHMGLMSEIICHRTLFTKRISDKIHLLAALNPYRRISRDKHVPGLVYKLYEDSTPDPMANLVYRVHPIPNTLKDFIFDFGSLTPENEKFYIQSMVSAKLINHSISSATKLFISSLIHVSQQYIRTIEKDPSSASLRDVTRFLLLLIWFYEKVTLESSKKSKISPIACASILALSFVYYFRIGDSQERANYWRELVTNRSIYWDGTLDGFHPLKQHGAMEKLLQSVQHNFCTQIEVDNDIALNQALEENLFVSIVCILNLIPVFIVGKPGSSKTLTMQVIASNLQGKQSKNKFWRKYPAVYIFPYQCSPMSDSHSIQTQFDMAVRYQQHAENTITILLLDEVGLAEHSPDMPLKVLHGMLVDPPISVVGLSNWVLDPAKMNRAILIQRTEPSIYDIQSTGKSIVSISSSQQLPSGQGNLDSFTTLLSSVAQSYHKIYTSQKGRDFIGMRDYYNLVKFLRKTIYGGGGGEGGEEKEESGEGERERGSDGGNMKVDPSILLFGLCRNFSGKKDLLNKIIKLFHKNCFGGKRSIPKLASITELIKSNLEDHSARHLMLLTRNSSALHLLFENGLVDENTSKVLIGSEFKDDKTELHLITQINEVKLSMANGTTVILLNHDNIYEALYDVLNQRYLHKTETDGSKSKMLRLAIGSRSSLCQVKDGFKIIVVVEESHAVNHLDLPLLNRFEKQILSSSSILNEYQSNLLKKLNQWCQLVLEQSKLSNYQQVFCGYYDETLPSSIMYLFKYLSILNANSTLYASHPHFTNHPLYTEKYQLNLIKKWLIQVARPIAVVNSERLKKDMQKLGINYFSSQGNLIDAVLHFIKSDNNHQTEPLSSHSSLFGQLSILLTQSPISHLDELIKSSLSTSPPSSLATLLTMPYQILQLAEINTEKRLESIIEEYFGLHLFKLKHKSATPSGQREDDHKMEIDDGGISVGKEEELLIIQTDPIGCSQNIINHTRYMIEGLRKKYELKMKSYGIKAKKKHILFLIHLPAGLQHRSRNYCLDFIHPWKFYFIDDLRPELNNQYLNTITMLKNSPYDLVNMNYLSIHQIIESNFQHALSACIISKINDSIGYFSNRMSILEKLLSSTSVSASSASKKLGNQSFYEFVEHHIVDILKYLKEQSSVHTHISMIISESLTGYGSMRQLLYQALQNLIIQIFAHILRKLDVNFNLSTLESKNKFSNRQCQGEGKIGAMEGKEGDLTNSISYKLWNTILNNQICRDKLDISKNLVSIATEFHVVPDLVKNTGLYGPLVSHFPFSYLIIEQLSTDKLKQFIMEKSTLNHQEKVQLLNQLALNIFGDDIVYLWNEYATVHLNRRKPSSQYSTIQLHMNYLHDLVALSSIPFPNIDFDIIYKYYFICLYLSNENALQSPPSIHVYTWINESRLLYGCSLLSSVLSSSHHSNIMELLNQFYQEIQFKMNISLEEEEEGGTTTSSEASLEESRKQAGEDSSSRVKILNILYFDILFIKNIINYLYENITNNIYRSDYILWLQEFINSKKDINYYLITMNESTIQWNRESDNHEEGNIIRAEIEEMKNKYDGLLILQLFIQEIIISDLFYIEVSRIKNYIMTIIQLSKQLKRIDKSYFLELISGIITTLPGNYYHLVSNFLRRFIEEILFKENQFELGNKDDYKDDDHPITFTLMENEKEKEKERKLMKEIDEELIEYLQELIFINENRSELGNRTIIPEGCIDLPFSRLLLSYLVKYHNAMNRMIVFPNITSKQIYLEYLIDEYTNKNKLNIENEEFQIVKRYNEEELSIIFSKKDVLDFKSVEILAKCQMILINYTNKVIQLFNNKAKLHQLKEYPLNEEESYLLMNDRYTGVGGVVVAAAAKEDYTPSNNECVIFILKEFYKKSGMLFLLQLIEYSYLFPWLPMDHSQQNLNEIKIPDFFTTLSENDDYLNLCRTLKIVNNSNEYTSEHKLQRLKEDVSIIKKDPVLLPAAIYSQIILPELISRLIEYSLELNEGKMVIDENKKKGSNENHQLILQFIENHLNEPQYEIMKYISIWLLNKCPTEVNNEAVPFYFLKWFEEEVRTDMKKVLYLFTIFLNCLFICISKCKSWMYETIFSINKQNMSFVLSSPDSEITELILAMKQSGESHPGWYTCPNGHRYTVGNCTKPMEKSKCVECGAVIGGQDHVSVAGNRQLNDQETFVEPERGYNIQTNQSNLIRLKPLHNRFIRLLLHSTLFLSSIFSNYHSQSFSSLRKVGINYKKQLYELLFKGGEDAGGDVNDKKEAAMIEFIKERLLYDFNELLKITELNEMQMIIAVNKILQEIRVGDQLEICGVFNTVEERNKEEKYIGHKVDVLFSSNYVKKIEEESNKLTSKDTLSEIRKILGDTLWSKIKEDTINKHLTETTILWRYRVPVSYHHFKQYYKLNKSEFIQKYPLLTMIVDNEKQLKYLPSLISILNWHNILFNSIENLTITRSMAMTITNRMVIHKLPEDKQKFAFQVFNQFKHSFNTLLPLIKENFYECASNPFIDPISGKLNHKMSLDLPIIWSLPSSPLKLSANQVEYLESITTIKLIELLIHSQNKIVEIIQSSNPGNYREQAAEEPMGQEDQQKDAGAINDAAGDTNILPIHNSITLNRNIDNISTVARKQLEKEHIQQKERIERQNEQLKIIPLSSSTPKQVLERKIINYSREKHLLPLLQIFSIQSLEYGQGDNLSYDLENIQQTLSNLLLTGKEQINVYIRNYQFAGEIKKTGRLLDVSNKIKQIPIDPSVLNTILNEIDTTERLQSLITILEIVINSIYHLNPDSSIISSSSSCLLDDFVNSLKINTWSSVSTVTLRQQIYLSHIDHLFNTLDEQKNGNPLDNVYLPYRVPLPCEIEDKLRACSSQLKLSVLLPLFKKFLIQVLSSDEFNYSPASCLRDYLGIMGNEDVELSEESWFIDYFPEEVTLSFALESYNLLSKMFEPTK